MMNSRLRFHISAAGKIVSTHPIHDRSGVIYSISVERDLSIAMIKDANDCVIYQVAGDTDFRNMVRACVNYLVDNLDVQFPNNVHGYNYDGLLLLAPTAQTITFTPTPTMGQFKLQYGAGPKTTFLQYNVTAAQMEAALRALTGLDEVCVSGDMASHFTISFGGVLSPSLLAVTDSTLDSTAEINHLIASQLAYTTQPSSSNAGTVFATQPIVTIRDAAGHTVISGPDSTALITITLQSGSGLLTGTTSMNAVAGVANFAGKGLKIDTTGNKTLRATKADTTGSGGTPSIFTDTTTLVITPAMVGPTLPSLGAAANYRILAKTAITTTGVTSITGDLGISPAAASAMTGFGLVLDGSGTFSTSSLVTGKVYASDYTSPTPANLTTAVNNMQTAYTNTNGITADVTELGAGTITGLTLTPQTYSWSTGVIIGIGGVTINGGVNDTIILKVAGTLDLAANQSIILTGGILPQNIYWTVAGTTTIHAGANFRGVVLAGPGASTVAMQNGATLQGRVLGQTDVTLIGNTITA